MSSPIIDIHTHCSPRPAGDPFGVAAVMRGVPVGKNAITNFRGLPAVSYHDMYDFDLQQEVCARAGVTGRIISTPFNAEGMSWASKSPAIDIVKSVNDQIAANRRALAAELGPRHAQPTRPPSRSRKASAVSTSSALRAC